MKKYNVSVAMKPWRILKGLLVHPKDKLKKEDVTDCVYTVYFANVIKPTQAKLGECWVLDY